MSGYNWQGRRLPQQVLRSPTGAARDRRPWQSDRTDGAETLQSRNMAPRPPYSGGSRYVREEFEMRDSSANTRMSWNSSYSSHSRRSQRYDPTRSGGRQTWSASSYVPDNGSRSSRWYLSNSQVARQARDERRGQRDTPTANDTAVAADSGGVGPQRTQDPRRQPESSTGGFPPAGDAAGHDAPPASIPPVISEQQRNEAELLMEVSWLASPTRAAVKSLLEDANAPPGYVLDYLAVMAVTDEDKLFRSLRERAVDRNLVSQP